MNSNNKLKSIKLKDALTLYHKERGAFLNSYSWYQKSAREDGTISIGNIEIPTFKIGGTWWVERDKLNHAIKCNREYFKHQDDITRDHKKGIIHGKTGDTIEINDGYYKIHGNFRFEVSNYEKARMRSDGDWYCNKCNALAETEHNKK